VSCFAAGFELFHSDKRNRVKIIDKQEVKSIEDVFFLSNSKWYTPIVRTMKGRFDYEVYHFSFLNGIIHYF
jgi:hypothetical protein